MKGSVFISSTFEDLREHRRKVWDLLRLYRANVRGMEEFGARKAAPLDTCLAEVEQCDVFVAIIGFRLGSLDQSTGKSFTQLEYERAGERNKDIMIYMMDPDAARIAPANVDREDAGVRLESFKGILRERHTVAFFSSPDDLVEKLKRDLDRSLVLRATDADPKDEWEAAAALLERFRLMPREYSGRQVRLRVKTEGTPFPASREVCDAFTLTFGKAIGVQVSVMRPEGCADIGLDEIYAEGPTAEALMQAKGATLDLYAQLKFNANRIERVRARFRGQSGYAVSTQLTSLTISYLPEAKYYSYDADAKVALLLVRSAEG